LRRTKGTGFKASREAAKKKHAKTQRKAKKGSDREDAKAQRNTVSVQVSLRGDFCRSNLLHDALGELQPRVKGDCFARKVRGLAMTGWAERLRNTKEFYRKGAKAHNRFGEGL
jgi:hypothetical protein